MQAAGEWVTIDEIGYLESEHHGYRDAVRGLMQKKRLIVVVRKQDIPFLKELRNRPDVFVVDLDAPYGNIGCVIMASGLGIRFGGNKLMADFHGVPLISHVFDATKGIFACRIVVTRHRDVAALCREQGIDVVVHDFPHQSDTVRLGINALGAGMNGCMFCSGDQPLLRQETVASLALAGANDKISIWRTVWETTAGTPVLFPKRTFSELLALPEGFGGSYVIKKYPEQVRTIPVRDMYELKDADTQEDLSVLLEQ